MARSLAAGQLSRRALLAGASYSALAHALGRTPYAGRLHLTLPWPINGLDPALLDDGFSALFSSAVFEPLYALDAAGAPYPALASALPSATAQGTKVTLRPGLKTSSGRALSGADLQATLERARLRGAVGILGEIEKPRLDPADPLSVVFPQARAEALSLALASPLLALVPRGFSPLSPDATGAFRVELSHGRALFTRNLLATRGAAFLDAIELTAVSDLAELLRGFEAGSSDVGWFGAGLYRAVKDAAPFEAPRYGFAALLPGRAAGAWGAPGILQTLLDAVPAEQLSHLGLRGLPQQAQGSARWGGPATELCVLGAAPQLVAVARALSATLSTPGHELTVVEKSGPELSKLKSSQSFGLLVDFVRAPGAGNRDAEAMLRAAASAEAAKRAPRTASVSPRVLGRELPLGVIGELAVYGARRKPFVGLESWQLGAASFRAP
jgi:peptide/nickel transport system substrate-binding protein